MTELLASGMPSDIDLIRGLSEQEDRGLLALSVPEAVTDAMALRLLEASGLGESALAFARLVRSCDFIVDRNHEWRLNDEARTYLQPFCYQVKDLWTDVNTLLYDATTDEPDGAALPTYLRDPAGRAYHLAALDAEAGISSYSELAVAAEFDSSPTTTWLASRLARDQQVLGILPEDSIDLEFLAAMALYHEGPRQLAVNRLRGLAALKGISMPIAVACHLVGRWDGDRRADASYKTAIKLLRRSIRIGQELGNERHVAQVQHSLALVLLIHEREQSERAAFDLLDESLRTLVRVQDSFGVAKVLHTYGQALARTGVPADRQRARAMLVRSLRLGRVLGKRRHEASVMESLAVLLEATDHTLGIRASEVAEKLRGDDNRGQSKGPRRANSKRKGSAASNRNARGPRHKK